MALILPNKNLFLTEFQYCAMQKKKIDCVKDVNNICFHNNNAINLLMNS